MYFLGALVLLQGAFCMGIVWSRNSCNFRHKVLILNYDSSIIWIH